MEMRKGLELVKKAYADFELARKYKETREYMTASMLYRNATEKVLRALYMSSKRREPPRNASVEYLAGQTKLPESIYSELVELPDETAELAEEENLLEADDLEATHNAERMEYTRTVSMHDAVRRLLEYAKASV